MTCLEAQPLLAGALADALPPPERQALETHLGACSACAGVQRRLQGAWTFLEGLQPPAVPMNLGQRLKSAAPAKSAPEVAHEPAPPPIRIPRKAFAWLAVALLACGVGWWEMRRRHPQGPPEAPGEVEAPPASWSHEGEGPMMLTAVRGAELWTEPGSSGALTASGVLRLDEGMLWGTPPEGRDLRLQAAGWAFTVTRGRFSVRVSGTAAVLSCHGPAGGLVVIERGPGFEGPLPLTDGTCALLVPGRPPLGPKPLRSPYPDPVLP